MVAWWPTNILSNALQTLRTAQFDTHIHTGTDAHTYTEERMHAHTHTHRNGWTHNKHNFTKEIHTTIIKHPKIHKIGLAICSFTGD